MSYFLSCDSFNEFNFPFPNTFIQEHEDELEEKKNDKDGDIFPIYLFSDIKEDLKTFENKGILTHKLIASGLSALKSNSSGKGWILSKLVLRNQNLHDVDILYPFTNINWLDMCCNKIGNMAFIQNMMGLNYLALSHNSIDVLEVFLNGLYELKVFNLSFNGISHMPCNFSQQFHSLTHLNLSHNFIGKVDGLHFTFLKFLQTLDLSYNKIKILENFTNLNIRELHVQHNEIKEYTRGDDGLSSNRNLIMIDISHNCISSLELFSSATSLMNINAASNEILNPTEILHLQYLLKLRYLNLSNNPLCSWSLYESYVISILKSLLKLDSKNTCNIDHNYHLNTNRNFWDQIIEYHGRNIIVQNKCLKKKNIRQLLPVNNNILIILVGTIHHHMECICSQVSRVNSNIGVLKKITTCPYKSHNLINVTNEQFHLLQEQGEFLQTVDQHTFSYGYSCAEISRCFQNHNICLTDMDMKAALSTRAFGLEPYLILVTVFEKKPHKDTLKENFDFLNIQSMNVGIIQDKEVSAGRNCSLVSVHTDHSEMSNDLHSNFENYLDTSVCDWYEFFNHIIGGPYKTKIVKTPVAEWKVEKLDEMNCLDEENSDCEEKKEKQEAKGSRVTSERISKRKELSINRQIRNNAEEVFVEDIFQKLDFYEEIYNDHREFFYSSVKLRDLQDGTRKCIELVTSIVENHGKRPMQNPYILNSFSCER